MHGTLQKGLKYENVKWSSGRVCSLQFKFEWQEGLPSKIFCDHRVITNHARDHGCDHSF